MSSEIGFSDMVPSAEVDAGALRRRAPAERSAGFAVTSLPLPEILRPA